MSEISVIGLGAMGAVLAQALLKAGHEVTVWNRSPEKMAPIVALGAKGATDLGDALRASPRIMICIADYKATSMLLDQPGVTPHLDGRTVIQLSTGTSKEAGDSDIWVREHGGTYLDGAIMSYPGNIGTADAQILVAGPEEAFQHCQAFFQCLGGDLRYLGPNVRAAKTLNLALLSRSSGMVFGVIHGAHVCEAEGIALEQFAALLPAGDRAQTLVQVILEDTFEVGGIATSVDVAASTTARQQSQAQDAGINSEFPDFAMRLLKRAIAAGYGRQDTAAVIKVLRGHSNT
jgi:3-hydroxyisobutyrate dehydrogenase-like beta-hydroxyacid dehydrogenase